jgi:Spy/CpxP family protein refolding chaperone
MKKNILCCFLVMVPALLLAQPGSSQDTRPFERIEQWKKVRLIEILELKEDQSARFFARMSDHDRQRRELMHAKGEALDRIERLVRNRAAAADLEKALPEVLAADDKVRDEQRAFFGGLSDILTVEQRAKLLLFERQFEKELREAMREAQRKRWRQQEGQ